MVWQGTGVEFFVFTEIFALEALAVDFVDFVELEAGLGFEGGEGADGLSGEGAPIYQEEHAAGEAGPHEAVDFIDDGEGFAGAGGHSDQHAAFAGSDGGFDAGVGVALVRAKAGVGIGGVAEFFDIAVEIVLEEFGEGGGGVEGGDFAGGVEGAANVVVPDDFAVGGVEEGDAEGPGSVGGLGEAFGIAFGLQEDVLGAEAEFFGFDDAEEMAVAAEDIVGGAIGGFEFFDGGVGVAGKIFNLAKGEDFPAGGAQFSVDYALSREPFGICRGWGGHGGVNTIMLHGESFGGLGAGPTSWSDGDSLRGSAWCR